MDNLKQIPRVIYWFELEGIFKGQPVQSPCNEQRQLQVDQVVQILIQFGLECLWEWGI